LGVDGPALLRERAAILGIAPQGTTSAGGTCRLLPAADRAWVAINLARRDDVTLLAAWMRRDWEGPVWDAVAGALARMPAEEAVERAQLLGIPAAVACDPSPRREPVVVTEGATARGADLVVDLSALWAGPLCGRLLAGAGMRVVKVEHTARPDGARAGPPEFWELLNATKDELMLDFQSSEGRRALAALLDEARVVVTSSRPRAVEHLGLRLRERVADQGLIWVSITGYGFEGEWRDRVAFGDDAAVAGGLAVAAGGPDAPVFVGDAPADPLAGLQAACAVLDTMQQDVGALVDVSMRDAISAALTAADAASLVGGA
jgi:CoA-transferase family III